jgi:hypothetical protein
VVAQLDAVDRALPRPDEPGTVGELLAHADVVDGRVLEPRDALGQAPELGLGQAGAEQLAA